MGCASSKDVQKSAHEEPESHPIEDSVKDVSAAAAKAEAEVDQKSSNVLSQITAGYKGGAASDRGGAAPAAPMDTSLASFPLAGMDSPGASGTGGTAPEGAGGAADGGAGAEGAGAGAAGGAAAASTEDVHLTLDFVPDDLPDGEDGDFDPELLDKVSKVVDQVIAVAPPTRAPPPPPSAAAADGAAATGSGDAPPSPGGDAPPPPAAAQAGGAAGNGDAGGAGATEVVKAAPSLSTRLETYGEVRAAVAVQRHASDSVKRLKGILEPSMSMKKDDGKPGITIYMTSVRAIRKTFEDCQRVRQVFLTLGARLDEKDISMDASFKEEFRARMGGQMAPLPRVFVGDDDIGGAREIDEMTEEGSLRTLLVDLGFLDNKRAATFTCEACGNARFVLCMTCKGSHKIVDAFKGEAACGDCNENGLRRCPTCTAQ